MFEPVLCDRLGILRLYPKDCKEIVMTTAKDSKFGPKADRLKLPNPENDRNAWKADVAEAVKKKKPKDGWPKPKPQRFRDQ